MKGIVCRAIVLLATVTFVLGATPAGAVDFNWNVAGPADWNVGTNWDPEGPPSGGGGNHAFVNNGGTAEITADIPDIQDIFVGAAADTSGTVNQTGGATFQGTGSWMFVGQDGGTGVYNLSGGTQNKERLFVGRNGGNGTLNLSDAGSVDSQFLVIGEGANAVGTAEVTGGSVHATSEIWISNAGGTGTLNQNDGVVEADTWIAIGRDSGTGVVNLSGNAVMRKMVVDDGNPENVTDSERSFITLGGLGSGSGGILSVKDDALLESDTNMVLSETGGRYGIVNQSGGTVVLHNNLANADGFNDSLMVDHSGGGLGEYHLSGGLLDAETINATTGIFDFKGGTLSATEFVGNLTQSGGTTSPGSSPGTMTVTGDYSLDSGDLFMEIEGTGAGTGYDQLIVTGDVSLAGDLTLAGSYVPDFGDLFTLIDNQGTSAISGMFTGIAEGALVSFNGVDLTATYIGGDGNDFVLFRIGVPEPASIMLIGLASIGLLSFARRRRW